jgi:hypothetical protein
MPVEGLRLIVDRIDDDREGGIWLTVQRGWTDPASVAFTAISPISHDVLTGGSRTPTAGSPDPQTAVNRRNRWPPEAGCWLHLCCRSSQQRPPGIDAGDGA